MGKRRILVLQSFLCLYQSQSAFTSVLPFSNVHTIFMMMMISMQKERMKDKDNKKTRIRGRERERDEEERKKQSNDSNKRKCQCTVSAIVLYAFYIYGHTVNRLHLHFCLSENFLPFLLSLSLFLASCSQFLFSFGSFLVVHKPLRFRHCVPMFYILLVLLL